MLGLMEIHKVHKILLGSALFELFEIKTIKETKKMIKPRLNVILEDQLTVSSRNNFSTIKIYFLTEKIEKYIQKYSNIFFKF